MVIDTAEAVLLFVLVALVIVLIILGIQVFFILRELRQTVSKANKVLEDTENITQSVSGPIASLSSLATGVKTGTMLARFFKRRKSRKPTRLSEQEDE